MGYRLQTGDTARNQSRTRLAIYLVIVAVVAIVVIASYAVLVIMKDDYRLEESDGALIYEIQDLPDGFYQPWDNAVVMVYFEGEVASQSLTFLPIGGSWELNSSRLTGTAPIAADFGARNISGPWFNLAITDVTGDGRIGDGDHLRIYSINGTFSNDKVYFMEFSAILYRGAPIYSIIFGFEFSNGNFDSWVEVEPHGFTQP